MRLEGQRQLSFASQRQEQEGQEPATVIEKDDATTTAQAKSKERKFFGLWLKKYSWLGYEKNSNYMYCRVCTETRKSKGMSNKAQYRNFQNTTGAHAACWSPETLRVALQGPEIRKSFEEARRKGETKQNKAV